MRILVWHVHGAWTTAFVHGPHEYLVPELPDRGPDGRGRAATYAWPASARGIAPERLADEAIDVVVLQRPQLVAFGTVAELASEAGSGAATVVRLAAKLGFDGFTSLQDAVQAELAHRLRPAAERIRQPVAADVIGRTMATELDNVQSTLEHADREAFDRAVAALSSRTARVAVLSGEASAGIAHQAVGELSLLREGVELVVGTEVAVVRAIALLGPMVPGWVGRIHLGPAFVLALGIALLAASIRRPAPEPRDQ